MNQTFRTGRTWVVVTVLAALGALTAMPAAGQEGTDPAIKQLMAANGLYQRKMYKLAAEEYEVFLAKYAGHAEQADARYGAATCYYQMGKYPEAVKHLRVLVEDKKFKLRDEALAVLGHCLMTGKDYAGALGAFDALLDGYPKSKHAEVVSLNRAQVLFQLNRPAESLKACQEFIKKYPKSARGGSAEYFLACSQAALNQHEDAEKTLKRFLKAEKDSPHAVDALLLLGQSLENQGQLDAAAEQYRKFIESAPEARKGDGYYSVGLVEYKNKKYGPAVDALSMVVSRYEKSPYVGAARLQLGLAQLAAGQAGDARTTLQKVASSDKERAAKASYWLIQCDMVERKFAEAREALDKLFAAGKGENLEAIAYDRAICGMELGRFEPAGKEFAEFIEKYPKSAQVADATYRQAFCLHKQGQYAPSQALCEKVPSGPLTAATQELSAENLFLLGQNDKAAKLFRELLPRSQGRQRQQFSLRLGQCEFLAGRYAEAIGLLSPVAADAKSASDPQFREAAFFLGDAQLQSSQYPAAAKTLAGYLASGGSRTQEAAYKLGLAQLQAGQTAEAGTTLGKLVDEPAGSPWVARGMLAYGQLLYQQLKEPAKASQVLVKVLEEKTKAPAELLAPATYLLGWIDFDAKRYDAAASRFAAVVDKHASDPLAAEAALQQATCLKESRRFAQALEILAKYEDKYPASKRKAEAKYLAATCLSETEQPAKAAVLLASLADADATCTDVVLYDLAWAQRKSNANAKAIEAYRKLLGKYSGSKLSAAARTELAGMLYLDKKFDEAAALAGQVVADKGVDPKTRSAALNRLAWAQAEAKQPEKAAKTFVELIETFPADPLVPAAMFRAGVCFEGAGKPGDAQKWLSTVIEKYPDDKEVIPAARLKLGESLAGTGQYPESATVYQTFLDKHAGDKATYLALFGLGWALENQKQYDQARAAYNKVVAMHNGQTAARAQFQIGECYFAEKRFKEAAKELLKVDIVYPYPEWSGKALYEAGRAFEKLGENDMARDQYALCVQKSKDAEIVALAKARLKALKNDN